MKTLKIVAVVLTFNEEKHIRRCIASISNLATEVVVIDSFSTDETVNIARQCGARVIQNEWIGHANQFNWALSQLEKDTDWVIRIDADEVITEGLALEVINLLPSINEEVGGLIWGRRIKFQGRIIRFGGLFPVQVLRMFRYGRGRCENRLMDEHIEIIGKPITLAGEMIDDNLNSLAWWIDKHNKYSSLEAIEILNLEYKFLDKSLINNYQKIKKTKFKQWIKENIYIHLPLGARAFIYYIYRYILCLGFMDGKEGASFHFLQALWYRYLVDSKIREVKLHLLQTDDDIRSAIEKVLLVKI